MKTTTANIVNGSIHYRCIEPAIAHLDGVYAYRQLLDFIYNEQSNPPGRRVKHPGCYWMVLK